MRSKSAAALTDSPGEQEQQLFSLKRNRDSGESEEAPVLSKANFQPHPFFSICDAIPVPLLNTSHQR